MERSRIWALVILFGAAQIGFQVKAEEFGNVFSGVEGLEVASREASTEALDGIIAILNAVRARETGTNSGVEIVLAGSDRLFNASAKMNEMLAREDFPNFDLTGEDLSFVESSLRGYWQYQKDGISNIKSFRALFEAFGEQTARMGNAAKTASNVQQGDRMFAIVDQQLRFYFAFADVVSEISSQRAPKE